MPKAQQTPPLSVLYTGLRAPARSPDALELRHLPLLQVQRLPIAADPSFLTLTHNDQRAHLIFTSPRGVLAAQDAWAQLGLDPSQQLLKHQVWAVGARTKATLAQHTPALEVCCPPPAQANFEGLTAMLLALDPAPTLLFSIGLEGSERSLKEALRELRDVQVHEIDAYATLPIPQTTILEALHLKPAWIVLMSPKGVEAIFEAARQDARAQAALNAAKLATIGPTTTAALERPPDLIASAPDVELLLEEIIQANLRAM